MVHGHPTPSKRRQCSKLHHAAFLLSCSATVNCSATGTTGCNTSRGAQQFSSHLSLNKTLYTKQIVYKTSSEALCIGHSTKIATRRTTSPATDVVTCNHSHFPPCMLQAHCLLESPSEAAYASRSEHQQQPANQP